MKFNKKKQRYLSLFLIFVLISSIYIIGIGILTKEKNYIPLKQEKKTISTSSLFSPLDSFTMNNSEFDRLVDIESFDLNGNNRNEILFISNSWNTGENSTGLLVILDYNYCDSPKILDYIEMSNTTGPVEFFGLNLYDIDEDGTTEILVTGAIDNEGWCFLKSYNFSSGSLELELEKWWYNPYGASLRIELNDAMFEDFDNDGTKEICTVSNNVVAWNDAQNTFRFWNLTNGNLTLEYETHFNPVPLRMSWVPGDELKAVNIDSDENVEILLSTGKDSGGGDYVYLYALEYNGSSLNLEDSISSPYSYGPKYMGVISGDFDADGELEFLTKFSWRDIDTWKPHYNIRNYTNGQFYHEFGSDYFTGFGVQNQVSSNWLAGNFDLDDKSEFISSDIFADNDTAFIRYWDFDQDGLKMLRTEKMTTDCDYQPPVLRFLSERGEIVIGYSIKDSVGNNIQLEIINKDLDGDGLIDLKELNIGTNPYIIDTDGDNFLDSYEVEYGTDPLDPVDYPEIWKDDFDQLMLYLEGNATLLQNVVDWVNGNSDLIDTIIIQLEQNATLLQKVIGWLDGNSTEIADLFTYLQGNATLLEQTVDHLDGNATLISAVNALATQNAQKLIDLNISLSSDIASIQTVIDQLGIQAGDTDYDGLTDLEELSHSTDPLRMDTDCDNLNDDFEIKYGTDPLDDDSDDDGYYDGIEVASGTNPLDPADYPGLQPPSEISGYNLFIILLISLVGIIGVLLILKRKS